MSNAVTDAELAEINARPGTPVRREDIEMFLRHDDGTWVAHVRSPETKWRVWLAWHPVRVRGHLVWLRWVLKVRYEDGDVAYLPTGGGWWKTTAIMLGRKLGFAA